MNHILNVDFCRHVANNSHMSTVSTLLCLDPSQARQTLIRRIAEAHQLAFHGCRSESEANAALASGQTFAVLVVAHQIEQGDSLQVIETARLAPLHATLPIAFLMGDRKPRLAQAAMAAGATEIFLRSEHQALMDFVGECSSHSEQQRYTGKVLLVEDSESHARYVEHLCQALGMQVDTAADIGTAEKCCQANAYQLIVVDVVLKDTKSGISFVRDIRQTHENRQPILVMSSFDDVPRKLMAMKSGADDFISKPFTPEEFVWRAKRIMERHADRDAAAPHPAPAAAIDTLLAQLSPREHEILQKIVAGESDRSIASELGISFWTVRSHIQHIFTKTGAINRRELMARFIPASRKRRAGG